MNKVSDTVYRTEVRPLSTVIPRQKHIKVKQLQHNVIQCCLATRVSVAREFFRNVVLEQLQMKTCFQNWTLYKPIVVQVLMVFNRFFDDISLLRCAKKVWGQILYQKKYFAPCSLRLITTLFVQIESRSPKSIDKFIISLLKKIIELK